MEHKTEVKRYLPKGKDNYHYIALCSCHRWRSEPERKHEDAETAGMMHEHRGDEHLRAIAAQNHGYSSLLAQYKWYTEMSEDPWTHAEQQEMWKRLADELRPRVQPRHNDADPHLF
jgi:hypothetical protein